MDIMGALRQLLQQHQQKLVSPLPSQESPGGYNSPLQPGLNAYYQREAQANAITPQQGMQSINSFKPMSMGQPQPMQQSSFMPQAYAAGPSLDQLTNAIRQGFLKYGAPEAAANAQYFAQAGQGLPDPYMPAILAIKETSAGKRLSHKNNYLNIGPNIDYPDVKTNLLGGGPNNQKGFAGVMKSGLYNKYLKSGDLKDFFNTYTPPTYQGGTNDPIDKQIKDYNTYKSYFTGQ